LNKKLWALLALVGASLLVLLLALYFTRRDRGVLSWPNNQRVDYTDVLSRQPSQSPGYTSSEIRSLGGVLHVNGWPVRWNEAGLLEVKHEPTGLILVLIPGTRGDGEPGNAGKKGDASPDPVRVDAFLLSKTEVPQFSWDRVGGGDRRMWNGDMLPIHGVSWLSAMDWCSRVELRLPTESEWERACRAGTTSLWCSGDDHEALVFYGWHDRNAEDRPHPVGSLKPNAWGLHDMHGNVSEWCLDAWGESTRSARGGEGLDDSRHDVRRVLRGGYWALNAFGLASGERSYLAGSLARHYVGLRPAMSLP